MQQNSANAAASTTGPRMIKGPAFETVVLFMSRKACKVIIFTSSGLSEVAAMVAIVLRVSEVFTSLRVREVAAMVAAPPRVRSRREEQARQATKCLNGIQE